MGSMSYSWVDWDALEKFCPKVAPDFFKWIKEENTDGLPVGLSILDKGFGLPFSDLPLWVSHTEDNGYNGLLSGIAKYRLSVGR